MENNNRQSTSVNHQNHPHQEGQQNNTRQSGQQVNDNNAQPMSNMLEESEEQLRGREKNKDKDQ
jgi:hypothetical protein